MIFWDYSFEKSIKIKSYPEGPFVATEYLKGILDRIQIENSYPLDYQFIDVDINDVKKNEIINISDRIKNTTNTQMLIIGLKTDFLRINDHPPKNKDPKDTKNFYQKKIGNFIEFTDYLTVSDNTYNLFAGFFKLIVVVNHLNGHVTVDIKIKDKWVTFDDSRLRVNNQVFQSFEDAMNKAYGRRFVHKPIMFIYLISDSHNDIKEAQTI